MGLEIGLKQIIIIVDSAIFVVNRDYILQTKSRSSYVYRRECAISQPVPPAIVHSTEMGHTNNLLLHQSPNCLAMYLDLDAKN